MQNRLQKATQGAIKTVRRFAVRVHGIVRRCRCAVGHHEYVVAEANTNKEISGASASVALTGYQEDL